MPLPHFDGSENCTFTVKVAPGDLSAISRQEITARRAVWGTDIYTDDSDIIAACIHQGWFRGEWPSDIDISLLDLELGDGPPPAPSDFYSLPPPRGPIPVPPNKSAHVTVIILPQLEQYSSVTRFGLRSREWAAKHNGYKGTHDGLSFAIHSVRWIDGVDNSITRSAGERKVMQVRDLEEAKEEDDKWSYLFDGRSKSNADEVGGFSNGTGIAKESFERGGGPLATGEFRGVGMNSWWKQPASNGVPKPAEDVADVPVVAKDREKEKETEEPKEAEAEPEQPETTAQEKAPETSEPPVVAPEPTIPPPDAVAVEALAPEKEAEVPKETPSAEGAPVV